MLIGGDGELKESIEVSLWERGVRPCRPPQVPQPAPAPHPPFLHRRAPEHHARGHGLWDPGTRDAGRGDTGCYNRREDRIYNGE